MSKNLPIDMQPTYDEPGRVAHDVEIAKRLTGMPPVDQKDAKQIRDRIKWYFDFCQETDTRPLVMGLCAALHVTRPTLIHWESENSERGEAIREAKGAIRWLIEYWTTSGRLSPPVGIFWSKNLLGFSDNITIEARSSTEPQAALTSEQIAAKIAEDIPLDEPEPIGIIDSTEVTEV